MRSLLVFAVLFLVVIGLSGCLTRQIAVTPLPSCYPAPSNLAELAGRCPKCDECVKGYVATEVWKVLGECPQCKVWLIADEPSDGAPRIVQWRLR